MNYYDLNGMLDIPRSESMAYAQNKKEIENLGEKLKQHIVDEENNLNDQITRLTNDMEASANLSKNNLAKTVENVNSEITRLDTRIDKESETVNNKIDQTTNDINSTIVDEVHKINNRMDNIISNNSSTEGNSELIDIRTDSDGNTYSTAGESVRFQIGKINEIINNAVGHVNLFNKALFTENSEYNVNTGNIMENTKGYGISDFIPVQPEKTLVFSLDGTSANAPYVYVFDSSKRFVRSLMGKVTPTFRIPIGAAYIRVCILNINADKFQIEYDSVTEYKPFINLESALNRIDKTDDALKTTNSEITDIRTDSNGNTYSTAGESVRFQIGKINEIINNAVGHVNLFNKASFTENSEYNVNTGNIMENTKGYGISDFIPVQPGKTLVFSLDGTSANAPYVYVFDSSKTFVRSLMGKVTPAFKIPTSAAYIRVCILNVNADKFQIEYDSVTEYKRFINFEEAINRFGEVDEALKTTDNEIIDIRTDSNGNIYPTAGDSVRFQVSKINEIINNVVGHANLFNKASFTENSEYNVNTGEIMENGKGYGISDFIPVQPGKTLAFSINGTAANATYIYVFDRAKKFVKSLMGKVTPTFKIPTSAAYVRVCILNVNADRFQIEYDSVTEYKPYIDLGITADLLKKLTYSPSSKNPLEVIENTPGYISCFLNVGCIGDSLASGIAVYRNKAGDTVVNSLNRYEYSWGQYLARMTGNTYYNWSSGGLRTDSWLKSSFAQECFDGNHLCQAYIIGLGQNDNNKSHGSDIGTIDDIDVDDYNNNADTFYGRYGKIIQKIKEVQPKAKIFVITDPNDSVDSNGYNSAIRNISDIFNNVYLIDMRTYWKNASCAEMLQNQLRYAHYNAVGYFLIAKMIMTYIDWIISNNYEDFREIENIGTDYYWYE